MSHRNDAWHCEKYEISSQCAAAGVSYQGKASKMEDFFRIIPNINGTDVSIYGVFDGHAGDFASKYSCDIIMPSIADKISSVMNLVQQKIKPLPKDVEIDPGDSPIADPLEVYITNDNKINYELLLRDEILEADKILNERLAKAVQFCGTTFCVVLVDISNNMILCANVGDSRAILCNTRAIAVQLSFDHKPNNPEELKRIHDNGGFVSKKEGCWRVEGSLATSRTLGDYPLKAKKVLTAEPDIKIMKYKEFK